jgi:rRNA maturation RNase YbeY
MKILFDFINVNKPDINYNKTSNWLQQVIIDNKKQIKEISVVFCNDEYLLELNKKYLNHDFNTDIITFNYSKNNNISGDLLISLDTVSSNAKIYNVEFNNELHRVMVHGILHLLGFDDKTEEQQSLMREKEDFYLTQIELKFP